MLYWTWISFIGFPILKFVKPLVFDCKVVLHLKLGNFRINFWLCRYYQLQVQPELIPDHRSALANSWDYPMIWDQLLLVLGRLQKP